MSSSGASGGGGGVADRTPGLVAPFDVRLGLGAGTLGANSGWACRVVMPKAGKLHDLAVWVTTQAGNHRIGVYDTGDALAANRTLLSDTGSVAVAAVNAWQIVGDPNLTVTSGQELDLCWLPDGASQIAFNAGPTTPAQMLLPTSFFPAPGGALPKLTWTRAFGAFAFATPLAEALALVQGAAPLIIGRVA